MVADANMSARSGGQSKAQTMDVQVRELREHVYGRDVQINTLKQHLALLTSDFKYNLKLLEDRDFELDQCEAHLAESEKLRTLKIKEMDLLVLEIASLRSIADRDAAQIQELETTLSQYKESVRSVRERLEEALQLRDQELTCHRSEIETLQTRLHKQTESLKMQEKGLGDAMKACEKTWSQRYSECHKTVMTLVAEQDNLLKGKLEKDKEMESMQDRAVELQKAIDELTQVADARRKECVCLTDQLETIQGRMSDRVGELEQEKQELEENLRKKILEEYDGKIAELLAQLQSIEYAVSLERREAHTRFVAMETQHAEQISVLHRTVQDLRRERDVLLEKVAKLEKELSSLKGSLFQVRNHETRLSEREASLTDEVSNLQDSIQEAQTLLEKSEVEKTHEISLLHEFLREARAKEHVLSKKEGEHVKHINILEKSLVEARNKVEKLSKRESEQTKELIVLQESFTEAKTQKEIFSKKNAEYVKELASLKKSLLEARNQADMFSKKHTEYVEEFVNLQQSLIEARNHGDMMSQKNDEGTKNIVDLKHIIIEARTQEDVTYQAAHRMRRKLAEQAKEIEDLQESFSTVKAEGELLLKAEASHAEEICKLRASLAETQKQADGARKHAKHLDAILAVTQAEARRRVEIKESVSCLITGAQDLQAFDVGQDSTTIEYSAPVRFPDLYSGATHSDQIGNCKPAWSAKDAQEFERGLRSRDQKAVGCSTGNTNPVLAEKEEEPQLLLEKENKFLKARVEELQAENLKVGQVISDLRHELETVGLLKRMEGFTGDVCRESLENNKVKGDVCSGSLENNKVTDHITEGPSVSSIHQSNRCSDPDWKMGSQNVKGPAYSPPEQETISLAEKEELQMLRTMMKDVHNRNAHFYTKVELMNFPQDKARQKSMGKEDTTCPPDVASDGGGFHEGRSKPHQQSHNRQNSTASLYQTGISSGLARGRLQEIPSENQSALTVSAEVLKLNEQIARVRQQLTSLCSTDQTDPSPSPRTVEKPRPQTRFLHFDIPPSPHQPSQSDSYEGLKAKKLNTNDQTISRGRNTSSLRYHDSCEQEDSAKPLKGPDYMHPRRMPNLDWTDVGDVLIGKSTLRPEYPNLVREVRSTHECPLGRRKEKSVTRSSARDSLGTSRLRTNVSKKLKVKVPSVASSHSDIVCTHCRRYMTDEEVEAVHHSSPEMSYNLSPVLGHNHSQCKSKPKHWQRFQNVDSSTGSEEREAIDHSLQNCQKRSKTCVVLPDPAGRWSDDSDGSRPSGSALANRRAAVASLHPNSHSPRKPWSKTRDRRDIQEDEKGGGRAQKAKDDTQLRKPSGTNLRKKGPVGTLNKGIRKEKAFPANLRDNIHSYHNDIGQFRVSAMHPSKMLS